MCRIQFVEFRDLQLWDFKSNFFGTEIFKNPKFPLTKISEFLRRNKTQILVKDDEIYKRITIKTKGQGIFLRDSLRGKNIGTKNQFLVKEGQFLISKIDARNGAFGIATKEVDLGIITGNFWTYDIDTNAINPHFLALLTTTALFVEFCDSCSGGTTGRHYLDEAKFLNSKIPLPPLEKQREIVASLQDLQDKIAAKEAEQNALKERIESHIYGALGLQKQSQAPKQRVFVVNFKDLERWDTSFNQTHAISQNAENSANSVNFANSTNTAAPKYPLVALGEICETNVGLTYSPKNISSDKQGVAVLRSNNIQNGKIENNDLIFVNMKIPNSKLANKGDLIMCVRNGSANLVGKTAMVEENGMSFGAFMAIIRSENNPFLYHFLQTDYFRKSVFEFRTSGINQISQSDIKNFKIPLPPLEIQRKIVQEIENLQSQISALNEQIAKHENAKQTLTQNLLW